MGPSAPLEARRLTVSSVGPKITGALEDFARNLHDLNKKLELISVDNATSQESLVEVKEATDRNTAKLASLSEQDPIWNQAAVNDSALIMFSGNCPTPPFERVHCLNVKSEV
jgi:hypothetical protein